MSEDANLTPLFDSILKGRDQDIRPLGNTGYTHKDPAPWIICADNATLSVQAGSHLYCSPRVDQGPYYEVEVGFPSVAPPETWAQYYDGEWTPENACDSIYAYVPAELVREYILAHGGEKVVL